MPSSDPTLTLEKDFSSRLILKIDGGLKIKTVNWFINEAPVLLSCLILLQSMLLEASDIHSIFPKETVDIFSAYGVSFWIDAKETYWKWKEWS